MFHYTSYASIFIRYAINQIIPFKRGLRIYKVLSYYEDYWTLMKHYGENIDQTPNKPSYQRMSNFMSREEARRLEKAKKWRENSLIRFMSLYIILPLASLSFLSFIVP